MSHRALLQQLSAVDWIPNERRRRSEAEMSILVYFLVPTDGCGTQAEEEDALVLRKTTRRCSGRPPKCRAAHAEQLRSSSDPLTEQVVFIPRL